jgi:hypothetical protein
MRFQSVCVPKTLGYRRVMNLVPYELDPALHVLKQPRRGFADWQITEYSLNRVRDAQ